ncbi:ABC transporter substrate-binding protein [Rhodococcus artemisiae]|uniref:ABC transporter substrate-binding protein n=1 Tax=Rhodococcus artemisiae TaxID=714159 RepID=A0ABU7LC52_9NOCA|nr:ABC transporter substrate-binding protein [Rhodococcus artemisiae]MEE2059131.1 ABC transporter substrate-binding protein [Rhodococcus artemisiae]
MYDRLTQIESGPTITPMLAESWSFAPDGMMADFVLRTDARFHDGTSVDADAVVASLMRARDPQFRSASSLSMVADIYTLDERTVRIVTTRPAADLPYVLASTHAAIVNPVALQNGVDLSAETAGSGPYEVDQVRRGDRITYRRSEQYWDPSAQQSARLEVLGITDENARLNALRSGQVDLIPARPGQIDDVEALAQQPQYRVYSFPTAMYYSMVFDIGREGVDDARVRQALNHAVDRESINEGLMNGKCSPTSQPLVSGVVGHNPDVENLYEYDPEKARQLLREASIPEGFRLRIVYISGLSPIQEMITALQAQLSDVGVDVEILAMPAGDSQRKFAEGGYENVNARVTYAMPSQTLLGAYLEPNYFPTAPSAELSDVIIASLNPNLGDEERTQLVSRASGIAAEQAYELFLCGGPTVVASSDKVVDLERLGHVDFSGVMDIRYIGKAS